MNEEEFKRAYNGADSIDDSYTPEENLIMMGILKEISEDMYLTRRYENPEWDYKFFLCAEILWGISGVMMMQGDNKSARLLDDARRDICKNFLPGYLKKAQTVKGE